MESEMEVDGKKEIDEKVDKLVLPGDILGKISDFQIRLGPGLFQNQESIVATKGGILRNPTTKYYWIENHQKRYVPSQEDMVVGVVKERSVADTYKIDIGSAFPGLLSTFAFEGATKKNRPNLQVGGVVYCRVTLANKDMEPELSCLTTRNKAEGYGELTDGYVFKCSLNLCYTLLDDECVVLKALGKIIPYEIAVGMNGRVWINSASKKHTVLLSNAILNSEFLKGNQIDVMVSKLALNFK